MTHARVKKSKCNDGAWHVFLGNRFIGAVTRTERDGEVIWQIKDSCFRRCGSSYTRRSAVEFLERRAQSNDLPHLPVLSAPRS